MNYKHFLRNKIDNLITNGHYRFFATIERLAGQFPYANYHSNNTTQKVIIWCGNDYLGMGQHPSVIEAMQKTLIEVGAGSGGTRNISGTTIHHMALENTLAELHDKQAALCFTSGYVANETTLSTLGKLLPGCVMISDSHNHASIIHGIRSSGCEKKIFDHNDMNHLRKILQEYDTDRPKIVIFESVYSMDGDTSLVQEICALSKRYNALTYLDEVHGVGMYGHKGGGVAQRDLVSDDVDIIQGNLGKAFGLMGGYIAGSYELIDCVRSFAPGFIFTTSLPPVIAAGATASIQHLMTSSVERECQQTIVHYLKQQLTKANLPYLNSDTHIVPIVVGDPIKCRQLTDCLLKNYNIYVQPINYPTVALGQERIRLTPSSLHTTEMVDALVAGLSELWKTLVIPAQAA